MWNLCFLSKVIRNREGANVWVIKLLLSLVSRSLNLCGGIHEFSWKRKSRRSFLIKSSNQIWVVYSIFCWQFFATSQEEKKRKRNLWKWDCSWVVLLLSKQATSKSHKLHDSSYNILRFDEVCSWSIKQMRFWVHNPFSKLSNNTSLACFWFDCECGTTQNYTSVCW